MTLKYKLVARKKWWDESGHAKYGEEIDLGEISASSISYATRRAFRLCKTYFNNDEFSYVLVPV